MPIYYNFARPSEPERPDEVAHQSNDLAVRYRDANSSTEALKTEIREELNHPVKRRVQRASHSHGILLYAAFTVAYILLAQWEWRISREIYGVVVPGGAAWLAFLTCLAVGLYCSACIAESTSQFALGLAETRAQEKSSGVNHIGTLYDRRMKRNGLSGNWLVHPITGFTMAILVCGGILWASRMRVAYLRDTGEFVGNDFQIYLPCVLYALEIVLGVAAVFFVVYVYCTLRMRHLRSKLTRSRDLELTIRHLALTKRADYVSSLGEYNNWMRTRGRPESPSIPPNNALRELLNEEFEMDEGGATEHQASGNGGSQPIVSPNPSPIVEPVPQPPSNGSAEQENERVNDLVHLMDELTAEGNSGIA